MFGSGSGDRGDGHSCHHHGQKESQQHNTVPRTSNDSECAKDRKKDEHHRSSTSTPTSTQTSASTSASTTASTTASTADSTSASTSTSSSLSSATVSYQSTSTTTTWTTSLTTMSSVTTELVTESPLTSYTESIASTFLTSMRSLSSMPFVMPMPMPSPQGINSGGEPQSPEIASNTHVPSHSADTTTNTPVSSSATGLGGGQISASNTQTLTPTSNSLPQASGCFTKRHGPFLYRRQPCPSSPISATQSLPSNTFTADITESSSMSISTTPVLMSTTSSAATASGMSTTSVMPTSEPDTDHNGDGHHSGKSNGNGSTNTVAIAGGVGAAGAIAVFSLLILFCLRRQRRRRGDAAGAAEKGQGPQRKWKKLGSRLRVNVQGLQSQAATAGATLIAAVPSKLRRQNGRSDPYGQVRNDSAGAIYPTQGTATPEPNVFNGPQSSTIRSGPFANWRSKLGDNANSPKPSPQPYPFLINNPLGEPQVAQSGSAASSDPFTNPPEPVYLRITNPDPGTPDSRGNTPRPKFLTAGPVSVSQEMREPAAYPFPNLSAEGPFVDPPPNATIRDVDQVPPSLLPVGVLPRKPVAGAASNGKYLQPPQKDGPLAQNTRTQKLPSPPPPPPSEDPFGDPVPVIPQQAPTGSNPASTIPYTIPANTTFDPSSTIYFVPSSHNSITPIETPLPPDISPIHRSASKDTKARSDPFDLDRPEIWASLRVANARARGSQVTDAATTERSAASVSVNWEERERESRMERDRWSRANPGRESPTIGIGI